MADPVLAVCVARKGCFLNNVLHLPGEAAYVDLDTLGIKSLDESKSWKAADGDDVVNAVAPMPIAPISPAAPGAVAPQVLPAGTRISGTGRNIISGVGTDARSLEPMAPEAAAELPTPEPAPERLLEEGGAEGSGEVRTEPGPLDKSIPDLTSHLAGIEDRAELERLRRQEVDGKSRTGALAAIDDRLAELDDE